MKDHHDIERDNWLTTGINDAYRVGKRYRLELPSAPLQSLVNQVAGHTTDRDFLLCVEAGASAGLHGRAKPSLDSLRSKFK